MPAIEARRRLAAILAADVVGYSRLMEAAESVTLDRLKRLRAGIIDPLVATHGGRLIKLMGDGALVEFPSVVEAVQCAAEIQRGVAAFEPDRPTTERIRLRIGINLGDVIADGEDLYGDGVNIAARIQALADPGGVVIAAAAFDQITGKLPFAFRDLREHTLKNMSRPVRIYALADTDMPVEAAPARHRLHKRFVVAAAGSALLVGGIAIWADGTRVAPMAPSAERPALAVLPFRNLADPSDAYFAEGLTEDIATSLAKFGDLAVVDPAAAALAAEHSSDSTKIGRDLGVRYLVRGTVRRDGDRQRVTAQLVEVPAGTLRWSQSYDGGIADVFRVQDDITRQLAGAMAVRLDQLEQARATIGPPDSLDVYEMVLRGRSLLNDGSRAGNRAARRLLAEAIALDPDYAPARVALGAALFEFAVAGWTEFPADAIAEAETAAHAALALDPDLASANRLLGNIYLSRGQYDLSIAELDRALALNPSDAKSYELRGDVLMWSGDCAAAIRSIRIAQKLNPAIGYGDLGWCSYLEGRFAEAVAMLTRGMPREPSPTARDGNIAILAAAYAELGQLDRAVEARDRLHGVAPFFDPTFFASHFRSAADRQRILDGFAKAGIDTNGQLKAE